MTLQEYIREKVEEALDRTTLDCIYDDAIDELIECSDIDFEECAKEVMKDELDIDGIIEEEIHDHVRHYINYKN